MGKTTDNERPTLLRLDEVLRRVGNPHRSTVWRWIAQGHFPPALHLSPRRLAWRESDVEAWLEARR
ncbi:MAG TPA: AlpA family phage regulatory protein [Candidatus Binatus sp.]|uniref:helix-turn-helix transcriptional regulator n=1 Tax=Candidatus Binatus sp. TaxID=2811406 RepID=UPI002B46A77F|nr:AlpA family phage regulatory protein [Candidatus Binatus sp.]HKN12798.1 AlpA family phage regulatory protein [Candidatus Binatus sp.]